MPKPIVTAEDIRSAFRYLATREREYVVLRVGLHDGKARTVEQIATQYKAEPRAVRAEKGRGLRKLAAKGISWERLLEAKRSGLRIPVKE